MSKRRKRPSPSSIQGSSSDEPCDEGPSPDKFVAELEALHAESFTTFESREGLYSLNHFDDWAFLPSHLRYFVTGLSIVDNAHPSASGRPSSPEEGAGHSSGDRAGFGGSDLDVADSPMDHDSDCESLPNPAPNVAEVAGSSSHIQPPRATGVAAAVQPAVSRSQDTDSHFPGISATMICPYMCAVQTALTDVVERVYQPLPVVSCVVPGISVFCVPSKLEDHGLVFSEVNFVMIRALESGGHQVKCDCDRSSDLAMTISALSGTKNPASHADSVHSPSFSDLCQHSRALLYFCRRLAVNDGDLDFNDDWWSDPQQLKSLMTFAARAVLEAEETFIYMEIDDTPAGSSSCRKLPYLCATSIYEVVLDPEVYWRRQRPQASCIPGSIVTTISHRNLPETVKCSTCPRNTRCNCVLLVEKVLHIQKVAKEYNSDVKVHDNGMSLSICGRSVTPISPFHHPNVVRKRTYTDGSVIPEDAWREAAARRFRCALP